MKPKLFYGWYIVIAGLVLSAYNGAIFVYGWTGFVNPIITTFGWSMAQVSLASSLRSLETGVFNPVWGAAVDRWSPRKLMLSGLVCSALGIFCLSQTRNLAMYYTGFLIVGLGTSLFTGILPLTVIARWFKRDIGKANGLFSIGVALGGVMIPLVVRIIDKLTWQTTLMFAAIGLLLVGIPLSFVFRDRPEDYGLTRDGRPVDALPESEQGKGIDFGTKVKDALKTRAFWYLGLVNLCHMASTSPMNLYAIPYLTGFGISRTVASSVISLYTLVSLFTRIPFGALSDIFKKSHMVALSVALQGIGFFIFWLIGPTTPFWLLLLFAVIYGFGLGGANPLRAPILSEYFGTENFGAIYGISSIFITVGTVVSQPLAGWIYDTYHDYKIWWLSMAVFNVLALAVILTIPAAKKKTEATIAANAS